jgi:UDP-N-acetylmuramyl-tripeptide synthetase
LTPAGVAILNGDEPRCHSLSLTNQTIFFGQGNHNHLSFALVSSGLTGMSLKFFEHQKEVLACQVPLLGVHNAYNLTAALAYLRHAGESWNDIAPRLPLIKSVPGRMELLRLKQPFGVIIDFAHTPDSVHQVCASCRAWVQGQLIVILGAGGNRDVDKRPLMGRAACENADLVWFTSDNPRNEDPMDIIDGLMSGSIPGPEIRIEPDRREAIAQALQRAKPQDLILILGKGHERTQTIGTQVIPFHDGEVVTELLSAETGDVS